MYNHLTVSFEKLKNSDSLTDFDIKFRGFDSTTEGKQWSYALHLVKNQGRFRTNAEDLKGYAPMLPKYRAMLPLWNEAKEAISSKQDPWLSREQIKRIIEPLSHKG